MPPSKEADSRAPLGRQVLQMSQPDFYPQQVLPGGPVPAVATLSQQPAVFARGSHGLALRMCQRLTPAAEGAKYNCTGTQLHIVQRAV